MGYSIFVLEASDVNIESKGMKVTWSKGDREGGLGERRREIGRQGGWVRGTKEGDRETGRVG